VRNSHPGRVGLVRTSLIDYPGRVATVLFTSGCNFRCPFCHNPELTGEPGGPVPDDFIPTDEAIEFLERRRNVIGGVVITGGEPLISAGIAELVSSIRSLGLAVKSGTNGTSPELLSKGAPDFVAVDVKCAPSRYSRVTGGRMSAETAVGNLRQTIDWILEHDVEHEVRTTVAPGLVDLEEFDELLDLVQGAKSYVLTEFRPGHTLDARFAHASPYPVAVLDAMRDRARDRGIPCSIRSRHARSVASQSQPVSGP